MGKIAFHPFTVQITPEYGIRLNDYFVQSMPTFRTLASASCWPDDARGHSDESLTINDILQKSGGAALKLSQVEVRSLTTVYKTRIGEIAEPFVSTKDTNIGYELNYKANKVPFGAVSSTVRSIDEGVLFDLDLKIKLIHSYSGDRSTPVTHSLLICVGGDLAPTICLSTKPKVTRVWFDLIVPDGYPTKL